MYKRQIKFSPDGRFAYLICELKNYISVYSYKDGPRGPIFELVQTISTLNDYHSKGSAACVLRFSRDWNYVLCSNAGDNSIGIFKVDHETGMLEKICILPISGDYPVSYTHLIYLSSADWMPRNLDRRVEILFPVENEHLKKEVMHILDIPVSYKHLTRRDYEVS